MGVRKREDANRTRETGDSVLVKTERERNPATWFRCFKTERFEFPSQPLNDSTPKSASAARTSTSQPA